MTKPELQSAVDSMVWYHRCELPHGIVTPGWAPQSPEHYRLPADLTGKSVLDIGCYDGWWTFECLKRGAAHVTAIDNFTDTIHSDEKRSFRPMKLCAEALGYEWSMMHQDRRLTMLEIDLFDLPRPQAPLFDLILFLGAAYHVRHPLLAFDIIKSHLKPGGMVIVESHICDDYSPYVKGGRGSDDVVLEFYPDDQLGANATNFWGPTLRALLCMMRVAGFERIEGWKIDRPTNLSETRGFAHGYAA